MLFRSGVDYVSVRQAAHVERLYVTMHELSHVIGWLVIQIRLKFPSIDVYMCVCVYVFVRVCTCVYVCVRMYVCVCIWMYVYMCGISGCVDGHLTATASACRS